ncbi:hypothetical protein Q4534_14000 [Cyclobacterium sp. 1_MG-2023]|uniref:hypothetical protein n=1 Tax=Cyclobacterium sp. 1_MG-2023 TaxID=3062681 RepID=UPI0026E17D43|nr:hypothetical protein [Cyclobacterium sp. 1_MG-2023]MDO6438531.1 hypothetical protein [Cyclobacterium sp. 1_MG-2023]
MAFVKCEIQGGTYDFITNLSSGCYACGTPWGMWICASLQTTHQSPENLQVNLQRGVAIINIFLPSFYHSSQFLGSLNRGSHFVFTKS